MGSSQLSTRSLRQMLCNSHIKIWNLANHMKKQNKKHLNSKSIGENLKTKGLGFFVLLFFMWFSISEPQSIWHKLLILRWLYRFEFEDRQHLLAVGLYMFCKDFCSFSCCKLEVCGHLILWQWIDSEGPNIHRWPNLCDHPTFLALYLKKR